MDLDYDLILDGNGWCSLQDNGNPGYITKPKQIKDCLGSVDTSQYDYFTFYFNSSYICEFEALLINTPDSVNEILLTAEEEAYLINASYQFIGLLPKKRANPYCKLTFRQKRSPKCVSYIVPSNYSYQSHTLESITK
ncbi:MAG: hypothetical protein ISP71_03935 [Flavobacteriales bacterium]|nr:hypothetical protein [Flavobacteriales bacterium]